MSTRKFQYSKKRELHKYGALNPDTVKSNKKRYDHGREHVVIIGRNCRCPLQNHNQNLIPVKGTEWTFRDQNMSHDTGITDSLQTLEFLVCESSFAGTNDGSKTHLQHPPSFDLGI